jgi:hypothetical protein
MAGNKTKATDASVDLDTRVLEQLVANCIADTQRQYGASSGA